MRQVTAYYAGKKYEIPESWLAGYCRHGRTAFDAIKFWHEQTEMKEAMDSTGAPK